MKKKNNRAFIRPMEERITSIKRCGKDVDEAVKLALAELKATEDQVDIEILEMPTKGFFGIGAKLAEVQVTLKKTEEEDTSKAKSKKAKGPLRKEEVTEEELKGYGSREKEEREPKKNRNRRKSNKKETGVVAEAVKETEAALEEPIMPLIDQDTLTPLEDNNEGLSFLKNMVETMGLDVNVKGGTDGKDIYFFIEGKDTGTIIGKRGATLDAIQYLTSLVINKEEGEYKRVVVDAENYRAKREKALEKLAVRLADKVARTKRSYKLEPMNPYERKVIHATLQKDGRVTTKSEGQDPSRRIVIEAK